MTDGPLGPEPSILRIGSTVSTLVGNLIPLVGVLLWGWETFQLLMLYWMETVILAFWTMRRLARLAPEECGTFKIAGVERPATPAALVRFFSGHAGLFLVVHLLLLWAFFSEDWLTKVHSFGSFFSQLFLANHVWVGLLFFLIAGWVAFVADKKPTRFRGVAPRNQPRGVIAPTLPRADGRNAAVGKIVGTLYVRVFIMQVAIIFGAWLAQAVGSIAPMVIVIVLKTLADLGLGNTASLTKGSTFSDGSTSFET